MFPNLTYIRLKTLASIIRFGAGGLGASPSLGEAVEVSIESRDKGRYIKTRVYNKAKLENEESQGRVPSPVLINWHGSGFVIPALGSDHVWCERVARETGVVVIDADYRKGPEDPFPAAVEDCRDVIECKDDDLRLSRYVTCLPMLCPPPLFQRFLQCPSSLGISTFKILSGLNTLNV
jgi:hypothetical protein